MKEVNKTNVTAEVLLDMVDEQRIVYNWQRIEKKRNPKRFNPSGRRLVYAMALVLLMMGALSVVYLSNNAVSVPEPLSFELSQSTPMIAVPSGSKTQRRIPLSDGSTMTLAPGASLEVKDNAPTRFRTALHRGWVRYNIIPGQSRIWEVDTGLCRIIVLGTQFTVNQTARAVHLAVHRGSVAVHAPTGDRVLAIVTAGKTYTLRAPSLDSLDRLANNHKISEEIQAYSAEHEAAEESVKRRTREVGPGANREARPNMQIAELAGLGASEDVNDILKRADEARLRNKPQTATTLLERILREHPNDPAVSLAALTLGKIRLDTLHQPREAALAFRKAASSKRLPAPLREQAYARCVEALRRAGDIKAARQMGELYKRRFPNGRWISWIERWSDSE